MIFGRMVTFKEGGKMEPRLQSIQKELDDYREETGLSVGEISDGDHSFSELYRHRAVLTAFTFNRMPFTWKSHKHYDNDNSPMYPGYFITGIFTPFGVASYHYNNSEWNLFKVPEIDRAPIWTPDQQYTDIEKLEMYINEIGKYSLNKETLSNIVYYIKEGFPGQEGLDFVKLYDAEFLYL